MSTTIKRIRTLLAVQSLVLLGGSIFAWYTVYTDFSLFHRYEGTIFKIQDCLLPNPVTTACFYGAIAFVIACVWSVFVFRQVGERQRLQQGWLRWLLVAGTIFAWFNFGLSAWKFWQNNMQPIVGCSGQIMDNPFTTPCFIGSTVFLVALILALVIVHLQKKSRP